MNELKKKLYNCFSIIDADFFDDFENNMNKRIVFQKYGLFFAFFFGLTIGDFGLYIHGPYNSELTDIGYEFARNKNYKDATDKIQFATPAVSLINLLNENLPLEDVNFLEVYSTYFYLLNKRPLSEEEAKEKLFTIKGNLMTSNKNRYFERILDAHNRIKEGIRNINSNIVFN